MTETSEFCEICPRRCRVNRNFDNGFCNEGKQLRIAKIVEHFSWEEPCLCANKGTLAVFFSGCNLRCEFCQNIKISRGGVGKIYAVEEFVALIEKLQENHQSIDLVTPTHFANTLAAAFEKIHKKVPIIWNSNGYETPQMIEKVSRFVDIFLVDYKFSSNQLGAKFSAAKDYFTCATEAIKTMCQLKKDVFENASVARDDLCQACANQASPEMKQGVIIRHLVLPNHVENSLAILDEIKKNFPTRVISIMSQFTPNGCGSLQRKLLPIEYKTVLAHLNKLNLENGYIQDFSSAQSDYVPDF